MAYWLLKTEPSTYSWDDLVRDGREHWDGVRNYEARNNMKAMKVGDMCFIYHSVKDKEIVGIAKVVRTSYQDPTTADERWICVDVAPVEKLKRPVSLEAIKGDPKLSDIFLVRRSRLSVGPIAATDWKRILTHVK